MANSKSSANLDAAGIFFVVLSCLWTVLLGVGMGYLWLRRSLPLVKLRGIRLSFTAIAFLHTYWLAVQLSYLASPFPAQAQYWIMGIYLPMGIALFHASNSRFLYVARQQRRFAHGSPRSPADNYKKLGRWKLRSHTAKMVVYIGVGMLVQLLLTVAMYLLSRKFHPAFGLPGTEVEGNPWEVNTRQTMGWEWWPSLVWQFFWSWIVAPVVLWRARRIHDTLGWRTQTMLCCIASLPATPMWLIALYVPAMSGVNQYWRPPQWIAISIMCIEIFSVFLPCWQAHRQQALQQETMDVIATWESRSTNRDAGSLGTATSVRKSRIESSIFEKAATSKASVRTTWSDESLLNMSALEKTLGSNPDPLRVFSALNDFSGENIAFLTAVAEWKRSFTTDNTRNAFIRALGIYHEYISPCDAEFPINISFQEMAKLEAIFDKATRIIYGDPRHDNGNMSSFTAPEWPNEASSPKGLYGSEGYSPGSSTRELHISLKNVSYWGEIPMGFSITVFDQAERSIKYLVLTNTWPKFLQHRRSTEMSGTNFSLTKHGSSLMDRISNILSCDV